MVVQQPCPRVQPSEIGALMLAPTRSPEGDDGAGSGDTK